MAGRSSQCYCINECLDKVCAPANGPLMMARHLISPMWLEEIYYDDDDGGASLCSGSKTAPLLLLGSTGET